MHFLLLGATGRTGLPVLLDALQRGHTVTALVRDPSTLEAQITKSTTSGSPKLSPDHISRLSIVRGSPLRVEDLTKALSTFPAGTITTTTTDAIISTLNARRTTDSPFAAPHPTDSPPRMMADSIANVITAVRAQQQQQQHTQSPSKTPPKIIVLSALGAGSSLPHTHLLVRAMISYTNMHLQYADHAAVEEELRALERDPAPVRFVLARPTRLTDGHDDAAAAAKVFDVGKGGCCSRVVPMMASISRDAVARFLVDAAEKDEWDGTAPILVG